MWLTINNRRMIMKMVLVLAVMTVLVFNFKMGVQVKMLFAKQ